MVTSNNWRSQIWVLGAQSSGFRRAELSVSELRLSVPWKGMKQWCLRGLEFGANLAIVWETMWIRILGCSWQMNAVSGCMFLFFDSEALILSEATSGKGTSPCRHTLTVELDTSLTCDGPECTMDTVSVVNVSGGLFFVLKQNSQCCNAAYSSDAVAALRFKCFLMRSNSEDTIDIFHLRAWTSSSSMVRHISPILPLWLGDSGSHPPLEVTRRGGRAWGWTDRCDNPHLPVAGADGWNFRLHRSQGLPIFDAGTAQAPPAVEVVRTERIGGGWTTEVIALAKMRLGHTLSRYA